MYLNLPEVFTLNYILEWAIRIAMLFIVPRNRKPSSATAWLVLIMIFPAIGLIIFLLIGSPKLSKRRRHMQAATNNKIKDLLNNSPNLTKYYIKDIPEKIKAITSLNKNLTFMPLLSGNNIKLFSKYTDFYSKLAKDIDNACSFVHIEFYIISLDEETMPVFEALKRASLRGIKIRVLYDTYGVLKFRNIKKMKDFFNSCGIEYRKILPLGKPGPGFNRPDLRNHRKIVCIDGSIAYTGSQNLIKKDYFRKDNIYYKELAVRINGPAAVELNSIFASDWYFETREFLENEILSGMQSTYTASESLVQILPSGPAYKNDNNLKLFTSLIHSAQERIIIINPYFVPDDSLMTAITSAAQRGVEVIMINSEVMDQKIVGHAQRSYYEELLNAGVKIYLYEYPVLLHSKSISVDNEIAVIGSSNLDIRSFQLNMEVTVVIYDKETLRQLNRVEKDYLDKSNRLTLKTWQKRPLRSILLDNLARLSAVLQ
jgi:cardiolipin synthase